MQDRFKFRVFDKEISEMLYPVGEEEAIEIDGNGELIGIDKYGCWTGGLNCILMQCTGLKDKNGKLIYEGDIVKNWDNLIYQIIWLGDCACFMVENIRSKNKLSIYALISLQNNLEIVGNIYENPELLEG